MRDLESQQSINQRINFLIDHFESGNKSAFGRQVDMKSGVVGDLVGGRLNKPSYDAIVKILTAYPSVSADWLVLGRGPMRRQASEEKEPKQSANSLSRKEIEELVQQITATQLARTSTPEDIRTQKILVAAERIRLEATQKDVIARIDEIEREIEGASPPSDYVIWTQLQELKREAKMNENSLWLNTNDVGVLRRIDTRNMPLEAQAVYRVTGEPDPAQHFGGLLTHRLSINEQQALQLLASKQIRGIDIAGVGYRVTELAVREFLGEA